MTAKAGPRRFTQFEHAVVKAVLGFAVDDKWLAAALAGFAAWDLPTLKIEADNVKAGLEAAGVAEGPDWGRYHRVAAVVALRGQDAKPVHVPGPAKTAAGLAVGDGFRFARGSSDYHVRRGSLSPVPARPPLRDYVLMRARGPLRREPASQAAFVAGAFLVPDDVRGYVVLLPPDTPVEPTGRTS